MTIVNTPITLEQLLEAKECRAHIQRLFIDKYGMPIISLTVMAIGEVKLTDEIVFVGDTILAQLTDAFANSIVYTQVDKLPTGYNALLVINQQALDIKKKCVDIEQTHPLGRLADIDVLDLDCVPLSRQQVGKPARKCLLCTQDAHICARNKTHSQQQLQQQINTIITTYTDKEINV